MNFLREIRWTPQIGDPTFMGWFTVAAYAVAMLLAARVWYRTKDRVWLGVALGMAALCVNKQFDLQTLLTAIGRVIAWHQGWIEERRSVQRVFILGLIAAVGIFGMWFIWRFNAFWRNHKLLAAGLLFLGTFILVRAVSFHHVDAMLKLRFGGMKVNWILELGGIALVVVASVRERGNPVELERKLNRR